MFKSIRVVLCVFLSTFVGFSTFGQAYTAQQQEIISGFDQFLQAVSDQDYSTVLDMTYPGIFTLVPRPMMEAVIEETFSDTTLQITFSDSELLGISDLYTIEENQYALMNYTFKMTMVFLDEIPEPDTEVEDDPYNPVQMTYKLLQETYGEEEVTYDKSQAKIEILTTNRAYGIKETGQSNWSYLEDKPEMAEITKQLLPEDVIGHFAEKEFKSGVCIDCEDLEAALLEPLGVESFILNGSLSGQSWDAIPEALFELKNLEILYLSDLGIQEVPESIGTLSHLKELSLAGNQIKALPESISKLKNLKELILFDNPMSKKTIKKLVKELKKTNPNLEVLTD